MVVAKKSEVFPDGIEEGNFPLLDEAEMVPLSKRRIRKMQSKEFKKRVISIYGRPRNVNVRFVNFVLTNEHAVMLIAADNSLKAKDLFDTLNQYPLGDWNLVENRAENRDVSFWYGGEKKVIQEPVVVSVYKAPREDALSVIK